MALAYNTPRSSKALVGFDGFTDEIISVVATRSTPDAFVAMRSIQELGKRLLQAADVSCNIELVTREIKMGGNAPILTHALLELGHEVAFVGAIGDQSVEPLFKEMASRCYATHLLGKSGHTDALEFEDGKVLLGKHASLLHICYDDLPKKKMQTLLDEATLFASVNWTMLPLMNGIWKGLKEEILPTLSAKERFLFVDLADPKKRPQGELKEAMEHLSSWPSTHRVILGLNASEAAQLGGPFTPEETLLQAKKLCLSLNIFAVVIHTKREAALFSREEEYLQEIPFCQKPLISTGAGDHFNAGFCSALLDGLSLKEALLRAIHTALFYIKNGKSPTQK